MTRTFIKPDGAIRTYDIIDGKVRVATEINHRWVINPTIDDLYAAGWQDYTEPAPEPYLPTIEELVEQRLRERYTLNQEFEVQRKRDTEQQAFADYYTYVEECIAWANAQPHREEDML